MAGTFYNYNISGHLFKTYNMKLLNAFNLLLCLLIGVYAYRQNDLSGIGNISFIGKGNIGNFYYVMVKPINSFISSYFSDEKKFGHTLYNWQSYSAPYGRVTGFEDGPYYVIFSRAINFISFQRLIPTLSRLQQT